MKLQLLAVVSLGLSALASKTFTAKIQIDPVTYQETEQAFEDALDDEEPALNAMEEPRPRPAARKAFMQPNQKQALLQAMSIPSGGSGGTPSQFEQEIINLLAGFGKGASFLEGDRKLGWGPSADESAEASTDNSTDGGMDMTDAIEKIKDLITSKMLPEVEDAHSVNQQEMDALHVDYETCRTTKDTAVRVAEQSESAYTTESPLHITCREGEAGLYQTNLDNHVKWRELKEEKDLKCTDYSNMLDKTGDQKSNGETVEKAGSEHTETYVRRISATICGTAHEFGNGGHGTGGLLDQLLNAKDACETATKNFNEQTVLCRKSDNEWHEKVKVCDAVQDKMDNAACSFAVGKKDACEAYAECYTSKKQAYDEAEATVRQEESDRKNEWKGLKRMYCLIHAFADHAVTDEEIAFCRAEEHNTTNLDIRYHNIEEMDECTVTDLYPTTVAYKQKEFTVLPTLAKGQVDANECTGVVEVSEVPKGGSPHGCTCERVTMNGPYSPGPVVKCENCLDIRRSEDMNSCPVGTKLFSPQSRVDWETFLGSATPLRAPNWVIDITRPANGCAGCEGFTMNSETTEQESWRTADGSPWWLRSSLYSAETADNLDGDYQANCFLDLANDPADADSVTFNDRACDYHSKSYYCQAFSVGETPKSGSPVGCTCSKVELVGEYSAGELLKCEGCLDVKSAEDKNSCPHGTKLFSPRTREDWTTFIASATRLADPHWIVDITRPQDGCGGCVDAAMNSGSAPQATWRTSDGSPWFLRSTTYEEPSEESAYAANCYMDLSSPPANENSVAFKAGGCTFHSASYYCQTAFSHETETTTTAPSWDEVGRTLSHEPAEGSPEGCKCEEMEGIRDLNYSAGTLLKCTGCLEVSKKDDPNSCPANMKIFAPQSREDWQKFFAGGGEPLRAPNWIIDITRPEDGCTNCTESPMNSANAKQHTWVTADGAPWWLRSSNFNEPSGDYSANCFMDLFDDDTEAGDLNEDNVVFSDSNCDYKSTDYYCQPNGM